MCCLTYDLLCNLIESADKQLCSLGQRHPRLQQDHPSLPGRLSAGRDPPREMSAPDTKLNTELRESLVTKSPRKNPSRPASAHLAGVRRAELESQRGSWQAAHPDSPLLRG